MDACKAIEKCLACVQSGCIWLAEHLIPCRQSLLEVEMRPRKVAAAPGDCPDLEVLNSAGSVQQNSIGSMNTSPRGIPWLCVMALFVGLAIFVLIIRRKIK